MNFKAVLLILGIMLLPLAGCNTSPTSAAAGQQQKQVLKVYLEGLRDRDFTKLQKSTHPKVFSGWPQDPAELRKFLAESQKNSTGNIKSWQFEDKPFVDELNGQTIIRTTLLTDRYKFTMDFDLRKRENAWEVYGVTTTNQVSQQKEKAQPK